MELTLCAVCKRCKTAGVNIKADTVHAHRTKPNQDLPFVLQRFLCFNCRTLMCGESFFCRKCRNRFNASGQRMRKMRRTLSLLFISAKSQGFNTKVSLLDHINFGITQSLNAFSALFCCCAKYIILSTQVQAKCLAPCHPFLYCVPLPNSILSI